MYSRLSVKGIIVTGNSYGCLGELLGGVFYLLAAKRKRFNCSVIFVYFLE